MDRLLQKAVQTGQKLEMIYLDADNHASQRVIRVLGVNQDTIKAFCFTRRQIRTFKTDKILSISPAPHKRMGA
ncbi:hypothetical protein [Lentibacillus sp. CBA3610]|uniref:WYL domain-containing protein n=1 Tax=Lentibacillus sp. CBA3610 TaxID=2518176 RepID=UPI001595E01F|nr:hypothetical protein [Lentibacillus sp. CBA3610]QKY68644.1 hypothetical protein Len3610_02515 [Lentibacillus sp. CBA3610]